MNIKQALAARSKRRISQKTFWARVGVSQTGGSRYETESRHLPETIKILLTLAYATEKQAQKQYHTIRHVA